MATKRLSLLITLALAAAAFTLAGCGASASSFQVGNCINWAVDSNGDQVPMKVSCSNPPDPAIDVVKAVVSSGQSCTVGDRFYTETDGSTLCLEDEYVMSPGG